MRQTQGLGRAIIAAMLLMVDSTLNIIYGIAALDGSSFFVAHRSYAFGSLHDWGWVTLIIGIAQLFAAVSVVRGHAYGRWFAIATGSLAAIGALLDLPAYPLWSIAVFGLSLWIVYGLFTYRQGPRARSATL